jgi:hypothetical protein
MEDVAHAGGKDEAAGQERNGLVSASKIQNDRIELSWNPALQTVITI